jgi:predicted N-acyltransferase
MPEATYRLALFDDPARIDAAAWDGLVEADPDANPFLRHAFLHALHASGSATPETGWGASFLTLWERGADGARAERLAAAVPLYLKGHSYGEYVFDWAWADAQRRAGGAYYPKWLVAVPFTPVVGTRILARDAPARRAAIDALLGVVRANDLSSLHVLFPPRAQLDALADAGMLVREGLQFHWRNRGYADFEAFLDALAQPKRKKIRAERRKVAEAGVRLQRRTGRDITRADWAFFHECYANTYAEHGSSPYLNLDFFLRLAEAMPEHLLLVLAMRGGTPVASAMGVYDAPRGALYGRYWGALEAVSCLHFECCYYQMIEFAIERRLQVFEGGAQGAHKLARGLDPVATWSAHWLRDAPLREAVRQFLARERGAIAATIDELAEHRALREPAGAGPGSD